MVLPAKSEEPNKEKPFNPCPLPASFLFGILSYEIVMPGVMADILEP